MFVVLTESNGTEHILGGAAIVCYTELSPEPGPAPGWTAICGHDLLRLLPLFNYGSEKLAKNYTTVYSRQTK